jgi:hypothetical protein
MRAGPLSDAKVIALLNRHFVPVYTSNEDYHGKTPAVPPDEVAAQRRIYVEALKEKRAAGSVCVYLVGADGKGLASMIVSTATQPGRLEKLLQETVDRLKVPAGDPVIPPADQAPRPRTGPGELLLHLVARADHKGSWGEFPSENWIVLSQAQWRGWLPPGQAAVGTTWTVARDDAVPVLKYFFPQTEICNFALATDPDGPYQHRIEQLSLQGKVVSVEGNRVRARLDGYPGRDDQNYVNATVSGYVDFERDGRQIHRLRLITDEATYGRFKFGVAVHSVP